METRFLLTKRGCHHCLEMKKVINKINVRLEIDKRIVIIDCFNWEEFGLRDIPLMDVLEKIGFNGYPYLYLNGAIIEPAPTPEILRIVLESFLKEELLI